MKKGYHITKIMRETFKGMYLAKVIEQGTRLTSFQMSKALFDASFLPTT